MSSGFVSESELAEARKRRQEEWEKVRTAEQPLERPEEPYDGRSLYDRLKEQKVKKDMEYEEAHKLKNLIRGLDDDEVQFLDLVDRSKIIAEKQQLQEEEKVLKEFRNRVATLQEESADKKIQTEIATIKSKPSTLTVNSMQSQKSLLMGVGIKRKNGESVAQAGCSSISKENADVSSKNEDKRRSIVLSDSITTSEFDDGQLKCIGILPGIGPYNESSDSEISTGSEDEPIPCGRFDLIGRKRPKHTHRHLHTM